MPQIFRVLQCYSCTTFQVQQLKKTNKWTCKVCNEKQSVIKVYDQGSAADCRKQVQVMNMTRKGKDNVQVLMDSMSPHPPEEYATNSTESGEDSPVVNMKSRPATILSTKQGRWTIFAEPKESDSDQDLEENEGEDTFTTSRYEFEQICRKVKKERSFVRSAHSRLTGFHPVSKTSGEVCLSKSRSTISLPTNFLNNDDLLFPYSSIGEEIGDMLNDHVTKVLPDSKSLHNLGDVYGSYHKIEEPGEIDTCCFPNRHQVSSLVDGDTGKTFTNRRLQVAPNPGASKWSKFMPLETNTGNN